MALRGARKAGRGAGPRRLLSGLKRRWRAFEIDEERKRKKTNARSLPSSLPSLSFIPHTHIVTPPPPARSKIEPSRSGSTRRGKTSGGGRGAAALALDDGRSAIFGICRLSRRCSGLSAFGSLCCGEKREEARRLACEQAEGREREQAVEKRLRV